MTGCAKKRGSRYHDGYAVCCDTFDKVDDRSLASRLDPLEKCNASGYRGRGIDSPYLWSFCNHSSKGRFAEDGKFDPDLISKQAGAAVLPRVMVNRDDVTGVE